MGSYWRITAQSANAAEMVGLAPMAITPRSHNTKTRNVVRSGNPSLRLAKRSDLPPRASADVPSLGKPSHTLWSEDVERHGIQVLRDPAALDDMLGFTERRKLTTSGIDLKSLEYRDPQVISDLLDDLARTSPGRQKLKGSASVWVKVKYSPANLGTVRVYNHVAGTYVTLPCTQPEYANGLSLWLHNILRKYTRIKNEKFMSTEDRCDALARFRASIDDFDPDMKFRHRRAVARLKHSPKFMDPDGHAVEVTRANPRHDGLAPIERPFDTLNRNDKGIAAPNARRGKPKAQGKPRKPKAEPAMISPISGNATAFALGGGITSSSEALSGLDWGNDL